MDFTPMTDEEIDALTILPEDNYNGFVIDAQESYS